MKTIIIEFELDTLKIEYELIHGEKQSDIAGSSDEIVIDKITDISYDIRDYTDYYTTTEIKRIEEIIFEQM